MRGRILVVLAVLFLAGCSAPAEPEGLELRAATTSAEPSSIPAAEVVITLPPANQPPSTPLARAPASYARVVHGKAIDFAYHPAVDPEGDEVRHIVEWVDPKWGIHPLTCTSSAMGFCRASPSLSRGTTPSWRVVAVTGQHRVEGAWQSVIVNQVASSPILISPPHNGAASGLVRFEYQPVRDPEQDTIAYTLEYKAAGARGEGLRQACPAGACNVQLPETVAEWEWRIHAHDGHETVTSSWNRFYTNQPPAAPVVVDIEKMSGAIQWRTSFDIRWTPSMDPEGDEVRYLVSAVGELGTYLLCDKTRNLACAVRGLPPGRTYTLSVTATDSRGATATTSWSLTTRRPVVYLHGLSGDGTTWQSAPSNLAEFPTLDFTTVTGSYLLHYLPRDDSETIGDIAVNRVGPAIDRALIANGYNSDQPIDIVAHSMGGLIARVLTEGPPTTISSGASIPTKWASQVKTVVMVGTPNRGFWDYPGNECSLFVDTGWYTSCTQMAPDSAFLSRSLGYAPTPSAKYVTIGGDDDDIVPPNSPRLDGHPHYVAKDAEHASPDCCGTYLTEHSDVFAVIRETLSRTL